MLSQHAYGNFVMQRDSHMTAVAPAARGGAIQHHVMSIFADSARTKMYGSLRERAGGSCRVQVTLF